MKISVLKKCPKCSHEINILFFHKKPCPNCKEVLDLDSKTKCILFLGILIVFMSCMAISKYLSPNIPLSDGRIYKTILLCGIPTLSFWFFYYLIMKCKAILVKALEKR